MEGLVADALSGASYNYYLVDEGENTFLYSGVIQGKSVTASETEISEPDFEFYVALSAYFSILADPNTWDRAVGSGGIRVENASDRFETSDFLAMQRSAGSASPTEALSSSWILH